MKARRPLPSARKLWRVEDGQTLEFPLPSKPNDMAWRDYLIMLLHVGAEIEHALMVQYLYAAYSLDDQKGLPAQRRQVAEWRDLILTVAKEEMGHLLTVQNLLCLVGGPVCFDRSHFPFDTVYLPFPFRLEPLSVTSVAWYVYAEAPQDWQVLLRAHSAQRRVRTTADITRVAKIVGSQVVTGHSHTVGQLYDRIIEVISNPDWISDADFRPETYAQQASWDDWGRGYAPAPAAPGTVTPPRQGVGERSNVLIMQMATRTEAIAALKEIGGQGESAHLTLKQEQEPSHFDRFLHLLDQFSRHGHKWGVVHRVPVNPSTMGRNQRPPGSTAISHPTSLLWARLFNLRYRALLNFLGLTFRLARRVAPDEPNVRGAVMHRIFGEMYNIKALSGILVRQPLTKLKKSATRAACAAPPFEMPYSLELPESEADCWRLHLDIL